MGTTAIWLTPSFKNRPVQGAGDNASAGYHGYWVTDFTQIDPHFGTNAELKAFIDKAHGRGIKVFFDIITNHTADVIDYAEGQHSYIDKAADPYRDASGQVFDDRDYAGGETFPALDAQTSFPYTPVFRDRGRPHSQGAGLAQRPDATTTTAATRPSPARVLDVRRLLRPRRPVHRAARRGRRDGRHLREVGRVRHRRLPHRHRQARQHGVLAGVRAGDARPRHSASATTTSSPSARCTTPTRPTSRTFTTEGRLDATLDFGFQGAGTNFAKGAATTKMRDFYAGDDYYTDTDSNAYEIPTFLGNHDMGRIGMLPRRRRPGARARPARALADVPHPRAAGRLLRRRAGLHRRRRRPGGPPGHVPEQSWTPTTTTT